MRITITGICGFIGSHTANKFIKEDWEVYGIDDLSTGKKENFKGNVEIGDIRTFDFEKFPKPDVIFHAAAKASVQGSIENPAEFHDHNVNGSLRVIEYAKKHDIPIVFASSAAVFGNASIVPTPEYAERRPISPYGLHKYIVEEYLRVYNLLYGLRSIILRYFGVYGERQPETEGYQTVLSTFLKQKKEGNPFTIVGMGNQRRDFVYVKDVAEANYQAAKAFERGMKFETFNIGTGTDYSITEIANMIDKDHPKTYLLPRLEPRITSCNNFRAKQYLFWEPEVKLPKWIKNI